jgi:chromate transport protein ChrA
VILAAAALAFAAIWGRRMVEWWGNPAAMIVFTIPPAVAFLTLYLFTRKPDPDRVSPIPNAIRHRSKWVDIGLLASLVVLAYFSPGAAVFYGLILTAAAAYWAGYCQGRADAQRVAGSSPDRVTPDGNG